MAKAKAGRATKQQLGQFMTPPELARQIADESKIDWKADSIVLEPGFGEGALLELLKYLFSNGPLPKFSLLSAVGKAISANDVYPSFPMNSLMIKYEDRDFIQPYEWLGVEFARGCKFACAFCSYPVLGVKGDYSRDAKDFELQMRDAYDRFGITKYYVSD